jgi:predicted Holliday junction resolvase-like endonuclease
MIVIILICLTLMFCLVMYTDRLRIKALKRVSELENELKKTKSGIKMYKPKYARRTHRAI